MPIKIVVPQLGESVAEGTVSKWLKAVGDRVRKEEPLVEIQTDKINVEIPAPAEGTLEKILVQEGTTVLVGTEIAQLSGSGEAALPETSAAVTQAAARAAAAAAAPRIAAASTAATAAPPAPAGHAPAAPASGNGGAEVEERNLSPAVDEVTAIRGSGVAGRVTRDDLLHYLQSRTQRPVAAPGSPPSGAVGVPSAAPAAAGPPPAFLAARSAPAAAGPREEVVPFSKVRKLIAEHMVRAKHTAAHTHCFDEADMSAIVALKKEWGPKLEAQGVRLTYMPFFIKASAIALRDFPWVNGEVRGDSMVVKRYYNIGMAVGRDEKGLIVPNLKDCDRTFSITNAGVYGAINSSPVINVPEVAILGVHKIVERPVIRDGQIVARPMMNASIGFDHRVVDGELAVKFLRRVCELLERPELLWFYA